MSEIYAAEGQKGLDREVIRMLYEYAELRGSHKSLARYRYAKDTPAARAIYQKYMDKIDDRYGQMDEADQKSVWYKPTEKAREYRAYQSHHGKEKRCVCIFPQLQRHFPVPFMEVQGAVRNLRCRGAERA